MPMQNYESDDERNTLLVNYGTDIEQNYYESVNNAVDQESNGEVVTAHVETAKYWSRWWMCGIFSLFGVMQGAIWNTWSPIDDSANCALGFSSGDIDLLTNWGPIGFLVAMPIITWMLDRYGLRRPALLSAFLTTLGAGLRCLPLYYKTLKYFIHVGQILNGISGCAIMASPPLLSNAWFPPEERVTATSLTTLFNYLGTGIGYVIGPLMVKQPWIDYSPNSTGLCTDLDERHFIRKQIMNLMYVEFEVTLFVFICMLIYFPSHPPKPPSASASMDRMEFLQGIKALRYRRTFIISTVTYALVLGGYGGWVGALSIILKPLNVTQNEAGKLGFFMSLAGCVAGVVIGWFADRFKGRIKAIIISLYGIAFVSYLFYISMTQKWLGFSNVGLWVSCLIIGTTLNAVAPLGMEMGADAAYPTSEAVSTSVTVWCYNLLSFVLLLALQFTDAKLANYLIVSFIGVSIPLLIFFAKEPDGRLHIDMSNSASTAENNTPPTVNNNVDIPNGFGPQSSDRTSNPIV